MSEVDVKVLASNDCWDMVAGLDGQRIVQHEVFIIMMEGPRRPDHLKRKIKEMNEDKVLGRGYELRYISEPELGCHVLIKNGWELVSTAQQQFFFKRFLQNIGSMDL